MLRVSADFWSFSRVSTRTYCWRKWSCTCRQRGAEDNRAAAVEDLQQIGISAKDVVIGLAASGRTPYVLEAVTYAREIGAKTASISCVQDAEISPLVDAPIEVLVGPEVVTGSSRMKAGTAQK